MELVSLVTGCLGLNMDENDSKLMSLVSIIKYKNKDTRPLFYYTLSCKL